MKKACRVITGSLLICFASSCNKSGYEVNARTHTVQQVLYTCTYWNNDTQIDLALCEKPEECNKFCEEKRKEAQNGK